ncbi:hypothetical protein Tco_0133018 [Tanacetum coccineum]
MASLTGGLEERNSTQQTTVKPSDLKHSIPDSELLSASKAEDVFKFSRVLKRVLPARSSLSLPCTGTIVVLNQLPQTNIPNLNQVSKLDVVPTIFYLSSTCNSGNLKKQTHTNDHCLLVIRAWWIFVPRGTIAEKFSNNSSHIGPPGQVTIQPQFFFNKDLDYLLIGHKERKIALSISKLKAARYLDFVLEELVPSLWVESEREYDISAAYDITHWWFRRKEFYINKQSEPFDREAVRSQMQILSVIGVKVFKKYGYNYLREIILRQADYQEYKISEKDFKNLHPNDFKDLFLLNIQEKLNHVPKTDKASLHTAVNMWIRNLDAADYYFKEDYTIVPKPRTVVYKDRNDQRKLMRLNELHKFSDGTLTRVMEKLDHMIKDFHLFEYNKGMETRKWSEDDKRRSKDFITAIEKRLQIRRIFRIDIATGGSHRLQPSDFTRTKRTRSLELKRSTINLVKHPSETLVFHNEDGNPARANIKQALGSYERPHKGVKASANSDVMYFFTSAQDGDQLQGDVRLCLGDDLKKAQDHNQRQV